MRATIKIVITSILLFYIGNVAAQHPLAEARYFILPFKSQDPNLIDAGFSMASSVMDKSGLIWIASNRGIVTFDGINYSPRPEFQTPELLYYTSNSRYVKIDDYNRLWIVTNNRGVIMYDINNNNFKFLNDSNEADVRLHTNQIGDIVPFNEHSAFILFNDLSISELNVKTDDLLHYPSRASFTHQENNDEFIKVGEAVVQDNIIWTACKYGVIRFDVKTKKFKQISYPTKPIVYNATHLQRALYVNDDELMVTPYIKDYEGFSILNTKTLEWKKHIDVELDFKIDWAGLATKPLRFISWDENTVIGCLHRAGFLVINKDDYSYEYVSETQLGFGNRGLQRLWDIFKVSDDLYIFPSHYNISRSSTKKNPFEWQSFNFYDNPKPNWQRSLYVDKGTNNLYIGTTFGDGVLELNWESREVKNIPFKSTPFRDDNDLTFEAIRKAPDGKIILGTPVGFFNLDLALRQISADEDLNSSFDNNKKFSIKDMYFFENDFFVITFSNGLYYQNYDTKQTQKIYSETDSVNKVQYYDIQRIEDDQYFVSTSTGLRLLKKNENNYFVVEQIDSLNDHLLNSVSIRYMIRTDEIIWIASDGLGIFKLEMDGPQIKNVNNYKNPSNNKYNFIGKIIYEDDSNSLWLNTAYGFSKFDLDTHVFKNFTLEEGIGFVGRNGKFFHQLYDKSIIAGALKGFHYFHPDSVNTVGLSVTPYIQSCSVDDNPYSLKLYESDTIQIKKAEDLLSFHLAGINFNTSPRNYYTYILEGYQDDWSKPSYDLQTQFTKIPGGEYTFRYKVSPNSFDWYEGQEITVFIEKEFHEYVWFWLLIGLLTLGLIYLYYKYRMQAVRSQAELENSFNKKINELEMNALRLQMNPHFVFNSINSINWFIIKNDKDNASNYLAKFSRLIRLILENSKSKLIPLNNELEAIQLYLEMEKLRFDDKFDYEFIINSDVNTLNLLIPPMIIQPFIENSIWHGLMNKSEKGKIKILVKIDRNKLVCIVEDDGIGRDAAQKINLEKKIKKQSLGLKITEDRLKFIEKVYGIRAQTVTEDLFDEKGIPKGTRVVIEIPQMHKKGNSVI